MGHAYLLLPVVSLIKKTVFKILDCLLLSLVIKNVQNLPPNQQSKISDNRFFNGHVLSTPSLLSFLFLLSCYMPYIVHNFLFFD